jgi:hypothetical protein
MHEIFIRFGMKILEMMFYFYMMWDFSYLCGVKMVEQKEEKSLLLKLDIYEQKNLLICSVINKDGIYKIEIFDGTTKVLNLKNYIEFTKQARF